MAFGIKLKVWGDFACFTRPEMKVERVSYDVITPSAARGILEAIYWKPSIRWVVDRVHVLKPIRFTNIRRNELGGRLSERTVKQAMKDGQSPVHQFIEEDRQQRAALLLRQVAYGVEAHFEITDNADANAAKHYEVFKRRAQKGQCFHHPYLGCREFPAFFEWVEGDFERSPLEGEQRLGWMLHDLDFQRGMEPRFFNAAMKDGVIDVPAFEGGEVRA